MTGEVREGARVRVVIPEAVVKTDKSGLGFGGRENVDVRYIDVDGDDQLAEYIPVAWLEVLPDRVKVGDKIEGEEAHNALPLGAVVSLHPGCDLVRTLNGFVDPRAGTSYTTEDGISAPRTVLYLPEQDAA